MKIPFVDLRAQYLAHKEEFDGAFRKVIDSTAFIGGEYVRRFEAEFAAAYGVKHCVSVANGTDAIYIVLKMLGIGHGDEVITTAASWISTSETISQTGAKPVFVDVDQYFNIDARLVAKAITKKTKAVIPVHLYGQPANVSEILKICATNNLAMVEDCAQSHFATFDRQRVGTFGIAGTFSFYPGKNLGAYGDAGAIITNSDSLASSCRMYANHGALVKHKHEMEGVNSRLDGLQAALLSAKLPYIHDWTRERRRVAQQYNVLLADVPEIETPMVNSSAEHVYHLYVVRTTRRDELKNWLQDHGVETAIHYPTALPLLPAYKYLNLQARDFPRAFENQARILSLPMYPELSEDGVRYVVSQIKQFFQT